MRHNNCLSPPGNYGNSLFWIAQAFASKSVVSDGHPVSCIAAISVPIELIRDVVLFVFLEFRTQKLKWDPISTNPLSLRLSVTILYLMNRDSEICSRNFHRIDEFNLTTKNRIK